MIGKIRLLSVSIKNCFLNYSFTDVNSLSVQHWVYLQFEEKLIIFRDVKFFKVRYVY